MKIHIKVEAMSCMPIWRHNQMQVILNEEPKIGDFVKWPYEMGILKKKHTWYKIESIVDVRDVRDKYRKCKPSLIATDFYCVLNVNKATIEESKECNQAESERLIAV